jgi:alpha-tubulin suppressor-like RCC1 family protein
MIKIVRMLFIVFTIFGFINIVSIGTATVSGENIDGNVLTWGHDVNGQLGDGAIIDKLNPVQVELSDDTLFTGITAISGGECDSVSLKDDGTVWTWGCNIYGMLGDGTTIDRLNPVQVKLSDGTPLTRIISISGGGFNSIALKNDGTVWIWGYNGYDSLGDGITTDRYKSNPVRVNLSDGSPLSNIVAISGGYIFTIALKDDGTVWAWGDNNGHGQLGDGTKERKPNPVQVILPDGTPLAGITAISVGDEYSIALKNDGTVWTWGCNIYGQLGNGDPYIPLSHDSDKSNPVQVVLADGTPLVGITSISGGGNHAITLKDDGTIWTWGLNSNGQLGNTTVWTSSTPVQVVKSDNVPLSNIVAIAGGGMHTIAIDKIYNFTGFFQPIDNLPTWNSINAGSTVPVKFSLNGNQGIDIFEAGFPASQNIACDSSKSADPIEDIAAAGSSGLSYNATIDQYSYIWKTNKEWKNSCRQLVVLLKDGTYHNASFNLK